MNNKPNYGLKAKVIKEGLTKLQRKVSLTFYQKAKEDKIKAFTGEERDLYKPIDYETAIFIEEKYRRLNPEEWKEAMRVNEASYKRTKRLKDRILNMLESGSCIFLTLTFTNETLENTSSETRKQYVSRYLKKVSNCYIANIDFGRKNEREHYHALVQCDSVDGKWWRKNCGSIDFERVNVSLDCETKLAKYINKLTNHAIKETTRKNCVIYSR